MKKYLLPIVALAFAACSSNEQQASYSVVPLPQEVNLTQDSPFKLTRSTIIAYPENNPLLKRNAEFLAEYIAQSTGYTLQTKAIKEGESATGCITLGLNSEITNPEGYKLSTSAEGIRIEGQTENGVFYGIQTLRKSIPAVAQGATLLLPAGEINDAPRFAYRGMMLDVGRHFFPVEFIKEYIDLLALHNMNTLHWHLTEDQGWRIEIKKYPKLTEIGSTRNRTVIGHNTDQYDNTPYGGFYTQDEAREIVRYAQERYITIIPEIDLPGHMLAALASYPELGCTGGPYEVCPRWGVFEDVLCIGNEKTLPFLEDVMTEIIDIFPSKYIHIGGDEAPRTRWARCPKCQALIRAKGLKADKEHSAEDRLQSYCMAHIEKFLNEKGRQIIGWDEILEGDVAPNATVMSWRGSAGGIKAAQMGHDVIMTPNTHCYFDYFQSTDKANEPYDAIGGYVPVEKVYSLEPTEGLNDEQKKHILGAQANLWTEYILSPEQVEYMVLPRMAALAEVQWTQPEKKDYQDFVKRLVSLVHLYQRDGLNYAKHIFDIQAEISTPQAGSSSERTAQVTLSTVDNAPIYYTLDGSQPSEKSQQYDNTGITIDKTTQLQAIAIRPDGSNSRVLKRDFFFNKATFCPIQLTGIQPSPKYTYAGAPMLVDGQRGSDNFASGDWLGFIGGDITAVIDLGKSGNEIKSVATHGFVSLGDWIMGCKEMRIAISDDGQSYREIATKAFPVKTAPGTRGIEDYSIDFDPVQTRYVQLTLKTAVLPEGHNGTGKPAFLFLDEIEIN